MCLHRDRNRKTVPLLPCNALYSFPRSKTLSPSVTPCILVTMHNRSNPVATTNVVNYTTSSNTYDLYDVTFENRTIHTQVTPNSSEVDRWLSSNASRRLGLLVGLDVEWRPNTHPNRRNPIATLQLCVGHACLIFHIINSRFIPRSLVSFLQDPNVTFLGVGIRADADKLLEDYGLNVVNVCDLRSLAERRVPHLMHAGLKTLCLHVLGVEVEKPQSVTRSLWDNPLLTPEQVKYAAIDAFLSYEIGRLLMGR